jgi:hypothetical protein
MHILLDEDVPIQVLEVLCHVLLGHRIEHVSNLGWKSKGDTSLYRDARAAGYEMIVTNDENQLSDPDITSAIKKSQMHWVSYKQRHGGKKGLAIAVASIIAAMPDVVDAAERAGSQRLFQAVAISPVQRFMATDPRKDPPRYWPR